MPRFCVGFKDADGSDLGNSLVTKEFLIESFPQLLNQNKIPTLWLWGCATSSLGDNTTISSSSPVQTIAGGTNWKQAAPGDRTLTAIKTDGTLWTWGDNQFGAIGDNTTIHKSSPVQTIAGGTNWAQVVAGRYTLAGLKSDGTLWTWGRGRYGGTGDNTTIYRSSPVQTISGGTNWKQISNNIRDGVNAIKTDGTLWGWGYNSVGILADNTIIHKSSPVQTIAGGTNWKQISSGYATAAIKTDGTLWVWGANYFGQLGIDTSGDYRSSPVQTIAGGTNWKTIAAQGGLNIAAIKTDGTLWAWGENRYGNVGDNTTIYRSSPVQVVGNATNWRQVAVHYGVSAIKTDGTLWGWGQNSTGKIGDNTTIRRSSPVQTIAGGTNWRSVSAFARFSNSGVVAAIRDLDQD